GPGAYEMLVFDSASEGAAQVAGRIERTLEQLALKGAIGVATFPRDGQTVDALSEHAAHQALGVTGPDSGAMPVADPEKKLSIERVASSDLPILILGETGSGKEVLAERIHNASRRADRPYVKLNCAAFNESLLESELFGHERGSFTGAVATKPGLF